MNSIDPIQDRTARRREGGAALLTTHGAYAAPPVRTRMLVLERAA